MMKAEVAERLEAWASEYENPAYFQEDPIAFPRKFVEQGASLQDIEIAAVFAAHFAWGRRAMIVRDLDRLFDEMQWRPYDYIKARHWRDDETSIHRTIKWSEVARICRRLAAWYDWHPSLEILSPAEMRTTVFCQKDDPAAANKKINMMRRWMVRRDSPVDFGLWTDTDPASLVMPLDVHVHRQALELGLTKRKPSNFATAMEITAAFREIWPDDPVRGDFALFGYGVTHQGDDSTNKDE